MTQQTPFAVFRQADQPKTADEVSERIGAMLGAQLSSHAGASRPPYAVAGTPWYDTANALLKLYDGAGDEEVMFAGAYGVGTGGLPADLVDLDATSTPSGFYRFRTGVTANVASLPAGASGYGVIGVFRYDNNRVTQVIYEVTGEDQSWFRQSDGTGVWQPWKEYIKRGDYGLGSADNTGTGVTLNATVNTGFYIFAASDPDRPYAASAGGSFMVIRYANNWLHQVVFRAASYETYERYSTNNGSTWSSWSKIFSQRDILSAVGQSSGVPTGGLIERGSNANGHYVRFADGTQICHHAVTTSGASAVSWTFPASFQTGPIPYVAGFAGNSAPRIVSVSGVGAGASDFSAWSTGAVRQVETVKTFAFGRWFA